MGTTIPLLNEYKYEFLVKRLPQSLLGGPKLRLGYEAPAYVYLNQILLLILPVLLGITLTAATESIDNGATSTTFCYVYGALLFIITLISNVTSAICKAKKAKVSPILDRRLNLLNDEDEVTFDSCCGPTTVNFVLPGKKFKVNIFLHALVAALIGAMGFLYLVPSHISGLFNDNQAAGYILCALGWISEAVGIYSVTVSPPPETAQFVSTDRYENYTALSRPFHLLIFFAVDIAFRYTPELKVCNSVLHILFVFLPLLWTIGILPPLDAFFLWLFEQAHVVLFGGSPMASDIRTTILLALSIVAWIVTYFIPNTYGRMVIMSACGYLFSLNLSGMILQLKQKHSAEQSESYTLMKRCKGFLFHLGPKEACFYVLLFIIAVNLPVCIFILHEQLDISFVGRYAGFILLALVILELIFTQIQTVYAMFGMLRNVLYPKSVDQRELFKRGKKKSWFIRHIRQFFINFIMPLMLMVYLGFSLDVHMIGIFGESNTNSSSSVSMDLIDILAAGRAYRWAWQHTFYCALEIATVTVLGELLPADSAWSSLSVGLRLLVVGLVRDRLKRLGSQLYAQLAIALSTWMEKKLRRPSTIPMLIANAVLFPIMCLLPAVIASCLAAPLLPLFTLPIFLIGYPRPERFWPGAIGMTANINEDTAFYRQLTPQLCQALKGAFASGTIGQVDPGNFLLARFQDRTVWIQVVERGFAYCTLSIKGLELQETSCHTVEAARVDDIMDTTFEQPELKCSTFTKYPLSILTPKDALLVHTYSDAKNQLTGIIDQPDMVKNVTKLFQKTLTWVLVQEVFNVQRRRFSEAAIAAADSGITPPAALDSLHKLSSVSNEVANAKAAIEQAEQQKSKLSERSRRLSGDNTPKLQPRKISVVSSGFPGEWSDNDSIFSNESDHYKKELMSKDGKKNSLSQHIRTMANRSDISAKFAEDESSSKESDPFASQKSLDKELPDSGLSFDKMTFGAPAQDVTKKTSAKAIHSKLPNIHMGAAYNANIIKITDMSKLSVFAHQLLPKANWLEVPNVAIKNTRDTAFDREWYRDIVSKLVFLGDKDNSGHNIAYDISADEQLCWTYEQLITACHMVLNVLGTNGSEFMSSASAANHMLKIYQGEIPISRASTWITDDTLLKSVVIKAYRYALKVAIEMAIMGGEEFSNDELREYMEEYDQLWYMGVDKDAEWGVALAESKPQLFSFTHNQSTGTYHSRVLSLTETPVYVGSLNAEMVRAQWANLNLELYYMTNDDEERYSIQANATLLRNLNIQAADPPLGYPIYASEPVSVPII